jgi:hypothetical protein
MPVKPFINKVLITLEVGNKTALFILLTKDGQIHRKGNGNPESGQPLKMDVSEDGYFEAFMMTVDEEIFNYTGVVKQPDMAGIESRLSIIFQGNNNEDYAFRVVYGSQSQGPPQDIVQILINAVKITEAWYQQKLQEPEETEQKKWWQFWK